MGALSTPLGIASIVLLLIGIALLIAGVVLMSLNYKTKILWWMWAIFIAGGIATLIAVIMLAIEMSKNSSSVATM